MHVADRDGRDALGRGLAALAVAALLACVWRIAAAGAAEGAWLAIAALVANLLLAHRTAPAATDPALRVRADPATGLLARQAFAEAAGGALRAATRRGRRAALLLVRLDPMGGEEALAAAADVVRRALPATAVAGRIDDETIAVLIPFDARHAGTIDALAEFLLGALAQPLATRSATIRVRAAIGIAEADGRADPAALVRRARIAAQAAKAAGRHRAARFDAAMAAALDRRTAAEAALRDGIATGRFVARYRPRNEDDRLTGLVVTAQDQTGGIADPMAEAERVGLAAELFTAVIRRAFGEARDWDAGLTLSTTLTPSQLDDPWLAQKIVKLLVETGFPPARLEIAVRETAAGRSEAARSTLGSLANQGVRLALVGLGGPGSSLAAIGELPFARLAIDPAVAAPPLAAAIAGLGASLGLPVTADDATDEPLPVGAIRRQLAERGLLPAARAAPHAEPLRRAG